MFSKKILVLSLTSFVLLVSVVSDPASVQANNASEVSCYSILRQKIAASSIEKDFLDLAPIDYASFADRLISEETGYFGIFKIDFAEPLFIKKSYSFGPTLGIKSSNAGSYINLLDTFNGGKIVDRYLQKYQLIFIYDKDDQSLIGCRANAREIKIDKQIGDITKDDVGMVAPVRVVGDVNQIYSNGVNYKTIMTETDVMNKSYSSPVYTGRMIDIFPETNRNDFNPYFLVDFYAQQVGQYYDRFLPLLRERLSDATLSAQPIGKTDWEVDIEQYKRNDGNIVSILGRTLITFNKKVVNEYTFIPWIRYEMTAQMLRLGQKDVSEIWFSDLIRGDDWTNVVSVVNGTNSLSQSGLSSSVIEKNKLKNHIDHFLDIATRIAAAEGDPSPNTSDEVKLFWRIKKLIDSGASEAELKTYIANYPAHLRASAEVETKILALAKSKSTDVKPEEWYATFIYDLMGWGVIDGYPDGTYRPANLVNRAEMAKIAVALFSLQIPEKVTTNPFPDVPKDAWYAPYVLAAKQAGVIAGYPDGTFRPSGNLNRAEATKILALASGAEITADPVDFPDVPRSVWYASYVNFAGRRGVVNGYSDGKFRPGSSINRAEIAKMAARAKRAFVRN